jgi:hypothetical protein
MRLKQEEHSTASDETWMKENQRKRTVRATNDHRCVP